MDYSSRRCRHDADTVVCARCQWSRFYPELDRSRDVYPIRPSPWDIAPTRPAREQFSPNVRDLAVFSGHRRRYNRNNPQFDDEHQTPSLPPPPPQSRPVAFHEAQTPPHTPGSFTEAPSSLTSPSSATAALPSDHQVQMFLAESRSLTERSAALMSQGREFCDLARITPAPRPFAYPSSEILRRDYEARLEAREALMERWRSHLYDIASWRESFRIWSTGVSRLLTDEYYNHDLVMTRGRLQRDERELGALVRLAGLDVPEHLVLP